MQNHPFCYEPCFSKLDSKLPRGMISYPTYLSYSGKEFQFCSPDPTLSHSNSLFISRITIHLSHVPSSHLADFPALLDNPLIRNGIMQSQHFKTISAYWDNLDVALVGIGSPAIRDGANWHAFYGGEESDDLNARQVAGDICSRFFDIHGAMVETNMSEKTLSIEMNKLKQARYSIGIAMSEEKYSGIVGALRGKYINCLVTNSSTAELLLK